MNPGDQILEWARQNGYTIPQIADELGYSHQALTDALERNQITPQLARALFERYQVRVAPTVASAAEDAGQPTAPETSEGQDPAYTAPKSDTKVGDIAEAQPNTYPPETDRLEKYRQEVRRILDKSRCRGI